MQQRVQLIQRVTLIGTPEEIKAANTTGYRFVSQCPLLMHDGQVDVMQLVIERQLLPAPVFENDHGMPEESPKQETSTPDEPIDDNYCIAQSGSLA